MIFDEIADKDEKYLMSSLNKSLEVLDLLSKHNGLRAIDISNALNINKASTFKMLYTLEKNKYISKSASGKYELGLKFILYGSLTLEKYNVTNTARPFLQELRDECNETVHLGVLDDELNVIFLAKESSNASVHMTSRIGIRMPFYLTALGKVLVANNLDIKMIERIKSYDLKRVTNNTITDYDCLIDKLNRTKEIGYGEDLEENELGLISYAAPINNAQGETIAAISISGPSYRVKDNKEVLIILIKNTAKKISEAIKYYI